MSFALLPEKILTNIANAIRSKTGSTDMIYPNDMAQEISDIQTGITPSGEIQISSDDMYDVSQYGTAIVNVPDVSNALKNVLDSTKSARYLCAALDDQSYIQNIDDIISIFSFNTTENVTSFASMFRDQKALQNVPLIDTSSGTAMGAMFYGCTSLRVVPALNCISATSLSNMFANCTELREIHITNIKTSLDLSASEHIGHDAAIEVIGNLATISTTKTLTLHGNTYDLLTGDEIAVATNKGWTVARA